LASFEADVAIEIAVNRIARITGLRAPDFQIGGAIPGEGRWTRRSVTGGKNGALRSWLAEHQPMGIEREPANIRGLQFGIEPFAVSAFRKPESVRRTGKHFAVGIAADLDLRPLRFGKILEQWEEPMGGTAGDDFEPTGILQFAKCPNDIAAQGLLVKIATL